MMMNKAAPRALSPSEQSAFKHEISRELARCDADGGLANYLAACNSSRYHDGELDEDDFQRMTLGLFSEATLSECHYLFKLLCPTGRVAIPFDEILVRVGAGACVVLVQWRPARKTARLEGRARPPTASAGNTIQIGVSEQTIYQMRVPYTHARTHAHTYAPPLPICTPPSTPPVRPPPNVVYP